MATEYDVSMRGEGGAPADRYAIRYYQKLWAEGGLMGKPERVNGHGFVMACPGRSSDVIHIYVWIDADRLHEARWLCHMCDPWMQVAGDILCQVVGGGTPEQAFRCTWEDFERILGGPSGLVMEHAGAALLTLHKAIIDYRVHACLGALGDGHLPLATSSKLRELGFVGREGQQHVRRLVEEAFADEALQIPHVKTQEWVALGTVQDVSLTVQTLLERRVIQRVVAQGCGFPRSFTEQRTARS